MKIVKFFLIVFIDVVFNLYAISQNYPPDSRIIFHAMPKTPTPGYLIPIVDPTFKTKVTRITDKAIFKELKSYHHYSKDQPWNSDGSLIMMEGWPAAILDGNTYEKLRSIYPSKGHHIWSNTNPAIIYGTSDNKFECQNAITGVKTTLHLFTQYTTISIGDWEGNISNDDKYAALRCSKSGINFIVVYDIFNDSIIVSKNIGSIIPNNVTMSQSGEYVAIEWDVDGHGSQQGITIHKRDDLSFVRQVSWRGTTHFDLGYDTMGNEVSCQAGENRGIVAVRLDNGAITQVTTDEQMSWPQHISCRNLNRPGWLYLSEFVETYGEPLKPNYQQIFAVKIDGSGIANCFAHVHHSTVVNYDRSAFGVPNRDGTRVMFRSDWEDGAGEINSYVATIIHDTLVK